MEYNDALISYGIVLSLLDENSLLASELYSHIGDVWNEIGNENTALSCYKETLKIANNQDFPSSLNLISILEKQGNFEEAFIYECQANEIDQTRYHIRKSAIHDYTSLERNENELLNNNHLTSIKKTFGSKRINFEKTTIMGSVCSTLFDNIALIYLHRGDYLKALASWKQGINIRCSF